MLLSAVGKFTKIDQFLLVPKAIHPCLQHLEQKNTLSCIQTEAET